MELRAQSAVAAAERLRAILERKRRALAEQEQQTQLQEQSFVSDARLPLWCSTIGVG